MTRIRPLVLAALLLVALVGCEPPDDHLLPVFGPEGVTTVESAETVAAERLVNNSFHRPRSSEYETQGQPVELTADQQGRLKKILLDPRSYDFTSAKGCMPLYGVRLRFQDAAGKIVDVLLCFQCETLAVYRDDLEVGGEDFDRISDELAELMKELFPDDPAISEL
ncbi:MAG TPA: hypothetical protein VGN57_07780 [Pirellulaceae bacterium]|jgi:hypothetical protein|nr:hypothetical protein [Pirellulaceae bacterium]